MLTGDETDVLIPLAQNPLFDLDLDLVYLPPITNYWQA